MELKGQFDRIVWAAAAGVVLSLGMHANKVAGSLSDLNQEPRAVQRDNATADPRIAIDSLVGWMPFGQADEALPPDAAMPTDIRLKLLGIVLTRSTSRSSAFIAVGTQPPRRFFVGDEIAKDRRLVEIFDDHITLRSDGETEILSLTEDDPLVLPRSDGASQAVGANGDLDALRNLIFDQANTQVDATSGASSSDR